MISKFDVDDIVYIPIKIISLCKEGKNRPVEYRGEFKDDKGDDHYYWFDEDQLTKKAGNSQWLVDGHHIICDQCGYSMCDKDREGDDISQNFCPNCGSKMVPKE